jgi:hypothetical protein
MNRTIMMGLAAVSTLAFASAATAAPVYNSTPAGGWYYGSGNDYAPANTAVLSDGADQLYLRMHERSVAAPASDNHGIYSFALGSDPVNFDWGITSDGGFDGVSALLTITNLGTGSHWSYDPFFNGNDNESQGDAVQNSFQLNWSGVGFDTNVNDTYRVSLTVSGLGGDPQSLSVYAKMGDGDGAVPEPASWAMMLGGFGLVGGAMRRRKATISFA